MTASSQNDAISSAPAGVRTLTALELRHCLRWYAHNRGYDGNSRWSRQEEDREDTDKVKNASNIDDEVGNLWCFC